MNSARGYEGFSRQHRERLVMGSGPSQTSTSAMRRNRTKARITVVVRKRPLTLDEVERGEQDILALFNQNHGIRVNEPRKNVIGVSYNEPHEFIFDRAYDEFHTNHDVYATCVRHLVDSVFREGAKCACFAYGQTGSGKTYTMIGRGPMGSGLSHGDDEQLNGKPHSGLLELAAHDCFQWLNTVEFQQRYGLYVSFYEIYCNKVYDLLNRRHLVRALETNSTGNVIVKDLKQLKVDDVSTIIKVINSGLEHRITGMNSKNNDSSRGHAILTLEIKAEDAEKVHGKLVFVDLAGSERGIDAMGSGKQTQTDGAGINRSLLALKECIRALDLQSSHVPFRDSELTKVLRDMFVGSSTRTLMISCVSPSAACCEQTLNTLRYADRVKAMRRSGNIAVPGLIFSGPADNLLSSSVTPSLPNASLTASVGPLNDVLITGKVSLTAQQKVFSSRMSGVAGPTQGSLQTPRVLRKNASNLGQVRLSPLKAFCTTAAKANGQKKSTAARLTPLCLRKETRNKNFPRGGHSRELSLSSSGSSVASLVVWKDAMPQSGRLSKSHSCSTNVRQGALRLTRQSLHNSKQSTLGNSFNSYVHSDLNCPSLSKNRSKLNASGSFGKVNLSNNEYKRSGSDSKSSSSLSLDERSNHGPKMPDMLKTSSAHNKLFKYFPNRNPNTLMAAASVLRKRYAEWNFPLVPEEKVPGKYLELDTAVKMIKGISALPHQDVKKFLERYCGRVQQFYTGLLKYHQQYVEAQTRLISAQRIMLDQLSSNESCLPLSLDYIEDLRSVVQTQLSLAIRVGKRVTEIERMISLEDILRTCHYSNSHSLKDVEGTSSFGEQCSKVKGNGEQSLDLSVQPINESYEASAYGVMPETSLNEVFRDASWKQYDVMQTSVLPPPSNLLFQKKDTTTSTSLTRYTLSSASSSEQSSSHVLSPLNNEFTSSKQVWSSNQEGIVTSGRLGQKSHDSTVLASRDSPPLSSSHTVLDTPATRSRLAGQRVT